MRDLSAYIRAVPDFPKPGIMFRDITPLLADGEALRSVVDTIAERYRGGVDMVLGIESRGFIIGAPVADGLLWATKPDRLLDCRCASRHVSVLCRVLATEPQNSDPTGSGRVERTPAAGPLTAVQRGVSLDTTKAHG